MDDLVNTAYFGFQEAAEKWDNKPHVNFPAFTKTIMYRRTIDEIWS